MNKETLISLGIMCCIFSTYLVAGYLIGNHNGYLKGVDDTMQQVMVVR